MKTFISIFTICTIQVATAQTPFKPGCTLPFNDIKVIHTIDKGCPIQGKAIKQNKEANLKQNKAKNNFCASGEPKQLKVQDFIDKHQMVMDQEISFGGANRVPLDREPLEKIGEGTVVYFIGYIEEVKYSNVSDGEAVNCKKSGAVNNDIHIELIEKKTETEKCQRISAEISPHYRPISWTVENLKEIEHQQLKIKLTGHFFFDASHGACPDSDSGYRASSWEIHPVYRVEVYVNKKWIDLDEWVEE